MTQTVKHEYDRIPYLVAFQNSSDVRDVYGGLAEITVLESYLLKPKDKPSDTVLVFMHPIGGGAYLPMMNALARAGHHVIYCNSRFRGTDSALLMEKVVEDLGECIKDAKKRLGYSKVVLAGWSGGGSLSVFYQQQAQHPTVTASPSGDGPDLTKLDLPAADGIMLLAAHISRHGTLTEWLDASILDEADPTNRDPELDLYNPDNPNQPPYTEEFLARYRAAQRDRVARIDAVARGHLARTAEARTAFGASGDPLDRRRSLAPRIITVFRTDADPRAVDLSLDPSERPYGSLFGRRPDLINYGLTGFGRLTTPEAWLSTWSGLSSNAGFVRCAPGVTIPTLFVELTGDQAAFPADSRRMASALGAEDLTTVAVRGLHFGGPIDQGEPTGNELAAAEIVAWLAKRHELTPPA